MMILDVKDHGPVNPRLRRGLTLGRMLSGQWGLSLKVITPERFLALHHIDKRDKDVQDVKMSRVSSLAMRGCSGQ